MKKLIMVVAMGLIVIALNGCKKNQYRFNSPEAISITVVTAAFDQEPFIVEQCYGGYILRDEKNVREILWYKVFGAVSPSEITIYGTEQITKLRGYIYTGIAYNLRLPTGENIPCYDSFLVKEINGNSQIITEKKQPDIKRFHEKLQEAKEHSKLYIEFKEKEEIFENKYPEFLTELYSRANETDINIESAKQKENDKEIKRTCVVVAGIALIQIAAAVTWKQRIEKIDVRKKENA